jgi:hypothetical protein
MANPTNNNQTGNKRATNKRPPVENQFSSTNQPLKNGRPKKYITTVTEETGYKKSEVTDCMLSMLKMPLLDIKRVADDPKTPSLEVMLARAIHGDCKRGELKNLSEILNRSFGKPKEQVEHSGELQVDLYQDLSKEEIRKQLDKLGLASKIFDK